MPLNAFPKVISQKHEDDQGNVFYQTGPDCRSPLPTFFYFGLTAHDSLSVDPYNQIIAALNHLPIRCVSLSVPDHDTHSYDEALKIWSKHLLKNEDFISPFIEKVQSITDFLVKSNLTDPQFLACGGLSRGAFFATHLIAKDDRFKTLVAFAPLTDFTKVHSLAHSDSCLAQESKLVHLSDQLYDKSIYAFIGNQDERVSTKACIQWIESILNVASKKNIRYSDISLKIFRSIGYLGHGTPPDIFIEGAHCLTKKWNLAPLFGQH